MRRGSAPFGRLPFEPFGDPRSQPPPQLWRFFACSRASRPSDWSSGQTFDLAPYCIRVSFQQQMTQTGHSVPSRLSRSVTAASRSAIVSRLVAKCRQNQRAQCCGISGGFPHMIERNRFTQPNPKPQRWELEIVLLFERASNRGHRQTTRELKTVRASSRRS